MATTVSEGIDQELCEYIFVKHSKVDAACKEPNRIPSKLVKHWTSLWVVLNSEVSPTSCFLGYCKKENDWLSNSKSINKISLDDFTIGKMEAGYSKKYQNILQLAFKYYSIDLAFDSLTKMDAWLKVLQAICDRFYVDLVRCPEQPHREGEYVVQQCVESRCYKVWTADRKPRAFFCWEWDVKTIRRIHWHRNLHKLEVEPGRASDTGEGHFYFTGRQAERLFAAMRFMIGGKPRESGSAQNSPLSSPHLRRELDVSMISQTSEGVVRMSRGGSDRPLSPLLSVQSQNYTGYQFRQTDDSEDDWTGASDCTGASSDSGFICPQLKKLSITPRPFPSQYEHASPLRTTMTTTTLPSVSSSSYSAHTMAANQTGESDYMNIIQTSLDKDNTYITINRAHPIHPLGDGFNEGSPTTTMTSSSSSSDGGQQEQRGESSWSLTEDGYCRMVPSKDGAVRIGSNQGSFTTAHSNVHSNMTSYTTNGTLF